MDLKVEVNVRLVWRCPVCQKLKLAPDIIAEMDEEDKEILSIATGDPNPQNGSYGIVPKKVRCKRCNLTFGVEE